MPEAQANKKLLLVTTTSQVRKPQTIANIRNMIVLVLTHIITEEYRERTLVISVLDIDTERGGIKISTILLVQEIRTPSVAMNINIHEA